MAKSPEEMAASMIANLKDKTGKDLGSWFKLLSKQSFEKHGEIVKHLKSEYEVTHGFANLIAGEFRKQGSPESTTESLVDNQYSGAKSDLRPIYDAFMKAIGKFGPDVEIAPKKSYVSVRRNKQFAIVQPSTKTRVDIGINCKSLEPTSRLELSGSFNSMVSHRVRITKAEEIDSELLGWIKQAYLES